MITMVLMITEALTEAHRRVGADGVIVKKSQLRNAIIMRHHHAMLPMQQQRLDEKSPLLQRRQIHNPANEGYD